MMTTSATATPSRSAGSVYARLWRRTPRNAAYLLTVFILAFTAMSVLDGLFWTGIGLFVIVIGLPIVVLSLVVARGFGVAERFLLQLTDLPPIAEPEWNRDERGGTGAWRTLVRPIRNGHYWAYLLHGVVVSPILSTITFSLTVSWLAVSLGGLTYWFWGSFLPRGDAVVWGEYVVAAVPWLFGAWSGWTVEVLLYLIAGVLFAVTLPWVLNGLATAHHRVARAMLGRWRSDDIAATADAEAAARRAAVQAEDASLRRLERDIHDGPQQRLVRLQLDLAALERRAEEGDAHASAVLAREARAQAKATLDELRALSSGVAPPLLQDRGLAAALQAIAGTSSIPVAVTAPDDLDAAVPPEVARTVYFLAAELLANVAKHADAATATVAVALERHDPSSAPMLRVSVTDDGCGGAGVTPGHGLAGLRDRVAGLRGTVAVDSPEGGPTSMVTGIPLPSDESGRRSVAS